MVMSASVKRMDQEARAEQAKRQPGGSTGSDDIHQTPLLPLPRSRSSSSSTMLPTTMTMTAPLARAATRSAFSTRTFATATRPLLAAARRPPASGDLHPLPNAAKQATAAQSSQPPIPPSGSGNSTAPEDHSSRPSGPGPSGPIVDPKIAAPETVSRGEEGAGNGNGNGNGNGDANWTTSFSGMSERPFDGKAAEVLGEELNQEDIEIKPGE